MVKLYVGIPPERLYPGLLPRIEYWLSQNSPGEITLKPMHYNEQCTFSVRDLFSAAKDDKGPVLLAKPVSAKPSAELRDLLANTVPVVIAELGTDDEIDNILRGLIASFRSGEPLLHKRLVGALLVLSKLVNEKKWGGTRNKNYMWASDIPKGRGVSKEYKEEALNALSVLESRDFTKVKRSQGKNKWALNSDKHAEIFRSLESQRFPSELQSIFERGNEFVSARELDGIPQVLELNAGRHEPED